MVHAAIQTSQFSGLTKLILQITGRGARIGSVISSRAPLFRPLNPTETQQPYKTFVKQNSPLVARAKARGVEGAGVLNVFVPAAGAIVPLAFRR